MRAISLVLLTFVAGFVDTATFVDANGLFAAHVTGNFVVFGAALARGIQEKDYLKLLTFPVFVLAVMFGTILYRRASICVKAIENVPNTVRVWSGLVSSISQAANFSIEISPSAVMS